MTLALLLSLFVGLALGLLGGGGSILSVPILTYAAGLSPKLAITSSLVVIAVTSAAALVTHLKSGLVCVRTGALFGAAGMVGAYAGGRLSALVPDALLLLAFGLVMLVTGYAMLRPRRTIREPEPAAPSAHLPALRIALRGMAVGVVTGLLGAGGGFLIVPALVLLGKMPMKRAVATSLLVIAMQSLAGFVGHLSHARVPWDVVVPVTLVATLGGVVGGFLVKRAPQLLLRRTFAWLVMLVAVLVVSRQLAGALGHSAPHAPNRASTPVHAATSALPTTPAPAHRACPVAESASGRSAAALSARACGA